MSTHPLEELLHPRSIAVVGASSSGRGGGFVNPLLEQGFKGALYPVNPKYTEVLGLKAYGRVRDIPGPVDFVISSIPAAGVLQMIADCAEKGVKLIHLFTARFSETGRKDAAELEQEILRQAKKAGIRLIGPNCMGVYYPAEGIAFNEGMPKESGPVGLASQSGQAVGEITGNAAQRGLRFSKAISYGNALDFNECDYLEYFTQDPETKLILLYIEGVRDGPRFLKTLRAAASVKPVIVLKGGRGEAGTRATASHTASLAGSREIWNAVVNQAGVINVTDIDEMVDIATAFQFLPEMRRANVGVVGGSGGSSVMAADLCEEAGLNVIPLPDEVRQELKKQGNAIWDWIGNPADFSISMGDESSADAVTKLMARHPNFDFIITFVSGPWRRDPESFSLEKHLARYSLNDIANKPVVMVFQDRPRYPGNSDDMAEYDKIVEQMKVKFIQDGYPMYPNIKRAASAVSKMISYYKKRG
ncbi:MAG: CoA-binding protein [Dehalococcoidales bacterium]|nr:MAG: CoA-binding protein [Dehalococcoidales bacterium]